MMINKNIKINNILILYCLILLLFTVGIIIVGFNKSFDITDEGGFLLTFKHVDIYRGGIYNYHIIITKLTDWLEPGIISYRWMALTLTLLSSLIFSIGLYKWLKANFNTTKVYSSFIFIFIFITIGSLLYYSAGITTIHNNTLTNFYLEACAGFILFAISFYPKKVIQPISLTLILLIGILCAFSFFTKFSTGILQLFIYSLFILLYGKKKISENIYLLSSLFLGCLIGFSIYILFFQDYQLWIKNFKIEYVMLSDHAPDLLLKRYLKNIFDLIYYLVRNYLWILLFPFFISIQTKLPLKYRGDKKFLKIVSIVFLSIFSIYQIVRYKFYCGVFANPSWTNAYFYVVVLVTQLSLIFWFRIKGMNSYAHVIKNNYNNFIVILLLLGTPVMGAFGTANPIFLNILMHAGVWFGIILIFIFYLSRVIKSSFVLSLFVLVPVFITCSQVADGTIYHPYYAALGKNKATFFQQTEKITTIPVLNGIYVDTAEKRFFTGVYEILKKNNFPKGYPILGYYIPGIIYAVDGISPGVPLFFNAKRDISGLELFDYQKFPPVIMVTDDLPLDLNLVAAMKIKGVVFPDDYLFVDQIYCPNTKSMLKVYFHKKS